MYCKDWLIKFYYGVYSSQSNTYSWDFVRSHSDWMRIIDKEFFIVGLNWKRYRKVGLDCKKIQNTLANVYVILGKVKAVVERQE